MQLHQLRSEILELEGGVDWSRESDASAGMYEGSRGGARSCTSSPVDPATRAGDHTAGPRLSDASVLSSDPGALGNDANASGVIGFA